MRGTAGGGDASERPQRLSPVWAGPLAGGAGSVCTRGSRAPTRHSAFAVGLRSSLQPRVSNVLNAEADSMAQKGAAPRDVDLYVLGGTGLDEHPAARDFPLINQEEDQTEADHLAWVVRVADGAMAARGRICWCRASRPTGSPITRSSPSIWPSDTRWLIPAPRRGSYLTRIPSRASRILSAKGAALPHSS
jgi:hypothetical protein